ncbi:alpha/beta fold hydrolase [Ruminococcus albus]|uniref:Pimeloyl-ACP methyl ester carboxylesterase n=1 Tax=Ruminococcus albus TaxID=1264 RepID=A0A1H7M3V6_RUMAL|nr:alpha/beta hydrolase [Ruminococcus albus]SEL05960.1 Pimeloyl-ACP methyl ester carboxylesterase [Ruminococcus albus]
MIHSFGSNDSPVIVLVHGMMTPWQVWTDQIKQFSRDYHVIVPELSDHTVDRPTRFISIEDEAKNIVKALHDMDIDKVSVLCGMSLGGAIAFEMLKSGSIGIDDLVLDGAPLMPMPKIAEKIMAMNYITILKKTKRRDKKTLDRCRRDFLPERFIDGFLKVSDIMEEDTAKNAMRSVCSRSIPADMDVHSRILFIHGTKANESISQKSAERLKKLYPETEVLCYKGDPHVYKAIRQTDVWIRDVENFLQK